MAALQFIDPIALFAQHPGEQFGLPLVDIYLYKYLPGLINDFRIS